MKWPTRRIADFCNTGSGGTPSRDLSERYFKGTIPWVKSGELREEVIFRTDEQITEVALEESAAKIVPKGAILVALYGATVGRLAQLGIDAATNQAVCHVLPDVRIADAKYVFYALQTKVPDWLAKRVGGAQPNISQQIIKDTELPLPPLSEQKRIAAILDKADAIRRMHETRSVQTRKLFSSVYLKLCGDSRTNPNKWPVIPVSDFVSGLEGGKNVKALESANEGTKNWILKVSAVTWGDYRPSESKPLPDSFVPPASYFVRPDDLLISRANTRELIGATVYVWDTPSNMVLPDKIWRFVWRNREAIEPLFVHTLFNQPAVRAEMGRLASGTSGSMKNIAKPKVLSMRVPLPPLEVQRQFAMSARQCNAIAEKMAKARRLGYELFSGLIQRAFRGEL